MPGMTRRSLVRVAGQGLAASALAAPLPSFAQAAERPRPPDTDPASLARDESFWSGVARLYPRSQGIVNLEHGYWGKMALPVLAHYQRSTAMVNAQNSYYARTDYPADLLRSEARVAEALGVAADEIVLTRNATEAVHNLIRQYTAYRTGMAVLYSDVDYPSFQQTMGWLKQAHGVRPIRVELPARASADEILARYGRAFQENPDSGMMLLTHASNQHGLVLPVAAIADLARRQGIDVICDCAQSWGLLDFHIGDLGVDWAAFNLHKWIGAPVGVGALYMKHGTRERIAPYPGETDGASLRSRVHTATSNFAAMISVPAAIDFHAALGGANKEARLRYLRSRWTEPAEVLAGLEVLGGTGEQDRSGMGAFRLTGRASAAQNEALQERLAREFGVFAVARHGLASGSCIRVTPQVFTRLEDVDTLVNALERIAATA